MNTTDVRCFECGACCRDHVPVADAERNKFSSELVVFDGERWWMKRHADGIHCAALDQATRVCTIYINRPVVCRRFPVYGVACSQARELALESGFIPLHVVT